jgi:hypothetical protein
MTDNREEEMVRRASRVPTLLRRFRSVTATPEASKDDAAGGGADKARVMTHLITKYLKLDDAASALQARLAQTTNPQTYDEIALMLAETRSEQSLCKARYDAIDADQPFTDPGPEVEDALLAAIRAVDIATQTSAAVNALLEAVHGVIQAYAARSTK